MQSNDDDFVLYLESANVLCASHQRLDQFVHCPLMYNLFESKHQSHIQMQTWSVPWKSQESIPNRRWLQRKFSFFNVTVELRIFKKVFSEFKFRTQVSDKNGKEEIKEIKEIQRIKEEIR